MAVIAIIGFIVALALPRWSASSTEVRVWMWQREISGGLKRARAHSLSYAVPVSVCGGTPATGCAATGWNAGWMAFEDDDGTRSCTGLDSNGRCQDHGGKLLEVGRGLSGELSVSGNHNVRHGVHYSPDNWGVAPGTFEVCQKHRQLGRVIISRSGRVRFAEGLEDGC